MKLISWNVNGLRACCDKGFREIFKRTGCRFLLLTGNQNAGRTARPGILKAYTSYWNYAEKKGYLGTAIFTRHQPLSVTYGLGIDEHDHEGRVITLEMENFYLVTVYTPNTTGRIETSGLPYDLGGRFP